MNSRPPVSERTLIEGPAGPIEAVIEDPLTAGTPVGIVCHPHPLYGGTMDNKVVTTVARALQSRGAPTVRFNFRGVGASAGTYDGGRGETADALAVASWAALRWPARPLIAAGFSFGAFVAMRVASLRPAVQLITVAPPLERFDFAGLGAPACPWLIIQGEADDVVDPQAVKEWVQRTSPTASLVLLPGVGHFFHGHLHELRDIVAQAVRSG